MSICSVLGFLKTKLNRVVLEVEDGHGSLGIVAWMKFKLDCVDLIIFK